MYSTSIGLLSFSVEGHLSFCSSTQVLCAKPRATQSDDNPNRLLYQLPLPSWLSQPNHLASSSTASSADSNSKKKPHIGIIGGGITGVAVAHALTQHMDTAADARITVLEGGMPELPSVRDFPSNHKPTWEAALAWEAATARNGNSIVPGACFRGLATKKAVWQVFADTSREWCRQLKEDTVIKKWFRKSASSEKNNNDFAIVPPYFSLYLWHCLGPPALPAERWSFIRFVGQFLYTTLLQANEEQVRGHHILQLSRATRTMYLDHVEKNTALQICIGHSQGFLCLYRSKESAAAAVEENMALGEDAYLMEWQDAIQLEPRLENIPVPQALYVVRRPNDYTANCNAFVRHLIQETKDNHHVQYRSMYVDQVQRLPENRFLVTARDGSTHEFDILVLAAGMETPLLATQLGVGHLCPTYPLRGFSLTVFGWKNQVEYSSNKQQRNLLRQPFKLDSMYCSSVTPWMARWVGFGEFTGYRRQSDQVPSIAPAVLARYAKAIFPDAEDAEVKKALVGFRPMSPDDLPIVGEAKPVPGLFFNTGHGSLGWTTGLASGDVCAQQIATKLKEGDKGSTAGVCKLTLADGTKLSGATLSPNRFTWWA